MNAKKTWILGVGVALLVLLILVAIVAGITEETVVAVVVILLLLTVGTLAGLAPFIRYWLARRDLFWTIVEEGTSKQVLRNDKFCRSLLSKTGFTFDIDWTIRSLRSGEKERKSGLYWVGIWPFFRVYQRTMRFIKALTDGGYERRDDPNTNFLLTGTAYQYALLFKDAEDKDKLPLSGQMTMTAMIINPYKALFLVKDWFDALVMRVLPRVRQYISEHTYDELINDPSFQLDADVFRMLGEPDANDGPSILAILKKEYGISLLALETVNIDPPPGYREATLRQFNAVQTAKAEAEETGGALDRMIDQRLDRLAVRLGFTNPKGQVDYVKVRQHLQQNPGLFEKIELGQLNLLTRDRAGSGLRDIRVANADGSNLDPATATAMSLLELWKGGGAGSTPPSGPSGPSGGGGTPIVPLNVKYPPKKNP